MITNKFYIFSILIVLNVYLSKVYPLVTNYHARLIAIDESGQRYEVSGRKCEAGVYFINPTQFKCICVHGVWGIYQQYCDTPVTIAGGENYCFKMMPNTPVSLFVLFGNPKFPVSPSLNHFRDQYKLHTSFYEVDEQGLDRDASSSFISITENFWELENENNEVICLSGEKHHGHGNKRYCWYDYKDWSKSQNTPWSLITGIAKECKPETKSQNASGCADIYSNAEIPTENGIEICNGEELRPFPSPTPGKKSSIRMPEIPNPIVDFDSTTEPEPERNLRIHIAPDICEIGFTREDVKKYWKNPDGSGSCSSSISRELLKDQLRRFAVLRINKVLTNRVKSLEQITELLLLVQEVMLKTCPAKAVSKEFLETATSAFIMFITEDFFYGIEELETDEFGRFKAALESCISRAHTFDLAMEEKECNITEFTGYLDSNKHIEVPPESSSMNFEPLIETVWKMFLNTHSYCYSDFQQINDHHHFSKLMMELFSESIYEKWISPLESEALYKFIVPVLSTLDTTMSNIDYCVGAASMTSSCPAWLHRSSSQTSANSIRRKRSSWDNAVNKNRANSLIEGGWGYCLQHSEDPGVKLGLARCAFPVRR